ncbi:MAG: flagellar basal body P-ring protein FlgI [Janthinobacterium lividum]
MKRIVGFLLLAGGTVPAHADRIKDIARFEGLRGNSLYGFGLVVGLSGTGDDNLEYTAQSMKNAATRLGVSLPPGVAPGLKNTAAVMITAELPAFAKPGQRIDVTVSALGKAKSLRGGTLLMAPMQAADGAVYALAQGNLAVGGFGAEGRDGSKLVVNTPSSGRIPGGAAVERAVANPFGDGTAMLLDLNDADFTTARSVAATINATVGAGGATAIDAMSIRIDAPTDPTARIALASLIENLDVTAAAPPARVIINARTGTVVIGANVRVLPTAIAHGNLTVRVTEDTQVSQPAPLSNGRTVVVPHSGVSADAPVARVALFAPGVALTDLVKAINALGVAPGDLVAILEALRQAGALRAELIVI